MEDFDIGLKNMCVELTGRRLEEWQRAIENLRSSKGRERRGAAKRLRNMRYRPSGPWLLAALERELEDDRAWETQYQLIMAIGESEYIEAYEYVGELSRRSFEHTMLYVAIGDTLVRLSGFSQRLDTVRELMKSDHRMLAEGGLRALAIMRVEASESTVVWLCKYADSLPEDECGFQCRLWVAALAANWDYPEANKIIAKWRRYKHQQLKRACDAALNGTPVDWKPL